MVVVPFLESLDTPVMLTFKGSFKFDGRERFKLDPDDEDENDKPLDGDVGRERDISSSLLPSMSSPLSLLLSSIPFRNTATEK